MVSGYQDLLVRGKYECSLDAFLWAETKSEYNIIQRSQAGGSSVVSRRRRSPKDSGSAALCFVHRWSRCCFRQVGVSYRELSQAASAAGAPRSYGYWPEAKQALSNRQ